MKIQKIYEKIKCYSYVSFDIFDTLVLRNVSCPEDVFSIVEYRMQKKYKNNNFRKIRIAAESEARRNIDGEITLDDIYLRMPYSDEQITAFKKCEIDTEITVSHKLETIICFCTVKTGFYISIFHYCK